MALAAIKQDLAWQFLLIDLFFSFPMEDGNRLVRALITIYN